ncbi:hypothetical protein IKG_00928 [Bacillus cereus VD200]|nr:hypothetical protein IKG_00928 [Bacillus cereus VD200]
MTFVLSKMNGFSIEEKVHEFESKGFLEISNEISNEIFLQEEENHRLLTQAQLDYYNLEDDAYGECRARSYSRYIKYVDSPDYILDNSNDYN